jgi:7,8-dihydropterin-6-yl-methyl-4-(beta-D-ribofuranosyl)aminobenzene 5'-phosphate synthase
MSDSTPSLRQRLVVAATGLVVVLVVGVLVLHRIEVAREAEIWAAGRPARLGDIELLKSRAPGLVSIGGHDSSDEAIGWFRDAFGAAYQELRVGRPITVGD